MLGFIIGLYKDAGQRQHLSVIRALGRARRFKPGGTVGNCGARARCTAPGPFERLRCRHTRNPFNSIASQINQSVEMPL